MKKQYLVTERTHYMCPNMHFGMVMDLEKEFDESQVRATLDRMADAHPFLKCVISKEDETDRLYYRVTPTSKISLLVCKDEATMWEDYRNISKDNWDVHDEGLLKVFIYPGDSSFKVLLVQHHLLVDGRGALELAQEFANDYVKHIYPTYVEEQLMENVNDLPPKSALSGISKLLIKRANSNWIKENQKVSYEEYSNFVKEYSKKHKVEYKSYVIDKDTLKSMSKTCKDNGFTMNDLLMARMYQQAHTDKIIIAADVRKAFSRYNVGALGNYATAMGITCKCKEENEIIMAQKVHKQVKKHMANNRSLMLVLACYFDINADLLDASTIAALDGFTSKAGKFVGASMFNMDKMASYSITNLGKVDNDGIKTLMFIPPASPAAKLTLGVVTLNGEMRACSSVNNLV